MIAVERKKTAHDVGACWFGGDGKWKILVYDPAGKFQIFWLCWWFTTEFSLFEVCRSLKLKNLVEEVEKFADETLPALESFSWGNKVQITSNYEIFLWYFEIKIWLMTQSQLLASAQNESIAKVSVFLATVCDRRKFVVECFSRMPQISMARFEEIRRENVATRKLFRFFSRGKFCSRTRGHKFKSLKFFWFILIGRMLLWVINEQMIVQLSLGTRNGRKRSLKTKNLRTF